MYESCPDRRYHEDQDLDYLFWYRMNKGPVKSGMNIGKLLKAAIDKGSDDRYKGDAILAPPYTPQFARQIQQQHEWESWQYVHVEDPKGEAETRVPEPQFIGKTLRQIAKALDHAGWGREKEEIKSEEDPPTPPLHYRPNLTSTPNLTATNMTGFASYDPRGGGHRIEIQRTSTRPSQDNPVRRDPSMSDLTRFAQPGNDRPVISQSIADQPAASMPALTTSVRNRVESRPSRGSVRSYASRLSVRDGQGKTKRQQVTCVNCGEVGGHETRDCQEVCGACGSDRHRTTHCDDWDDACPCSKVPKHLRLACKEPCRHCQAIDPECKSHEAMTCEKLCHYCLSQEHRMLECPGFLGDGNERENRRSCRQCANGEYHLAGSCIKAWCPVGGCPAPLACDQHCPDCGWERKLDTNLENTGRPSHRCQWKKNFQDDPNNPTRRRVVLQCLHHKTHPSVKAEDLIERRAKMVAGEIDQEPGSAEKKECLVCETGMEVKDV